MDVGSCSGLFKNKQPFGAQLLRGIFTFWRALCHWWLSQGSSAVMCGCWTALAAVLPLQRCSGRSLKDGNLKGSLWSIAQMTFLADHGCRGTTPYPTNNFNLFEANIYLPDSTKNPLELLTFWHWFCKDSVPVPVKRGLQQHNKLGRCLVAQCLKKALNICTTRGLTLRDCLR